MGVRLLNPTSRRDVRAFVELPFRLYAGNEQWVPPLVSQMRLVFDRKRYPYYRHSEAAFFLAERDGVAVGRIAALDNRRYNNHFGSATAFFYYFECEDDRETSGALFEAAFTWARGRGLRDILGPKGLVRSDGHGLLVEGFEHRPAMGIPYNLAYYPRLVEAAGFGKEIDYVSGLLRGDDRLPERFVQVAEHVKQKRGFHIKTFRSKSELRTWLPAIQRINNEGFTRVWGQYPMEADDLEAIAKNLLAIADPRLIKLVMKGDEVVGFLFAYPELAEGLRRAKGRLWPFGWWPILREMKRTRWISINGVGILPQHQGVGANAVLYAEMQKSIVERGADFADVAQAAETNMKSLAELNSIGVRWYKRHRIYRREL